MNCKKATKSYEAWLAKHTRIIEADLRSRHQQMSADIFSFMRATFIVGSSSGPNTALISRKLQSC